MNHGGQGYALCPCFWVTVAGMAHGTEAGHKEVVTSVVGWCVLFDICKFDKLKTNKQYKCVNHLFESIVKTHLLSFIPCYISKKYPRANEIYEIP